MLLVRMLGGGGVERMVVVLVSWSCLLGVQPASVDTPEPKDHDRILHGKPLSDQVSRYVVREDAWGRGWIGWRWCWCPGPASWGSSPPLSTPPSPRITTGSCTASHSATRSVDMGLGSMLGDGRVERVVLVLVSWSCLLGVQPASVVDAPEPKDHDRILHGKPLSDQVSRYVIREDAWGRGGG
jgi:hypothetical protein